LSERRKFAASTTCEGVSPSLDSRYSPRFVHAFALSVVDPPTARPLGVLSTLEIAGAVSEADR